jgi:hypothetical protein
MRGIWAFSEFQRRIDRSPMVYCAAVLLKGIIEWLLKSDPTNNKKTTTTSKPKKAAKKPGNRKTRAREAGNGEAAKGKSPSKKKQPAKRGAKTSATTSATTSAGKSAAPAETRSSVFPVLGIGASAGGLEALEDFFRHMPPTNGMAFVVVMHQAANSLICLMCSTKRPSFFAARQPLQDESTRSNFQ